MFFVRHGRCSAENANSHAEREESHITQTVTQNVYRHTERDQSHVTNACKKRFDCLRVLSLVEEVRVCFFTNVVSFTIFGHSSVEKETLKGGIRC
jgi:hypothetical protein